jgi:hypothetical protein
MILNRIVQMLIRAGIGWALARGARAAARTGSRRPAPPAGSGAPGPAGAPPPGSAEQAHKLREAAKLARKAARLTRLGR